MKHCSNISDNSNDTNNSQDYSFDHKLSFDASRIHWFSIPKCSSQRLHNPETAFLQYLVRSQGHWKVILRTQEFDKWSVMVMKMRHFFPNSQHCMKIHSYSFSIIQLMNKRMLLFVVIIIQSTLKLKHYLSRKQYPFGVLIKSHPSIVAIAAKCNMTSLQMLLIKPHPNV